MPRPAPLLALALLAAAPAQAATDNGHTGTATPRTAPELSDLALFVAAVGGVWLTRRALRKRHKS